MSRNLLVGLGIFAVALIASVISSAVLRRLGCKALWINALAQGALLMGGLFVAGWADTSESPLWLSFFVVAVTVVAIATIVLSLRERQPLLAVIVASVTATVTCYLALVVSFVLMVYFG